VAVALLIVHQNHGSCKCSLQPSCSQAKISKLRQDYAADLLLGGQEAKVRPRAPTDPRLGDRLKPNINWVVVVVVAVVAVVAAVAVVVVVFGGMMGYELSKVMIWAV
jgi:hypothetical protein